MNTIKNPGCIRSTCSNDATVNGEYTFSLYCDTHGEQIDAEFEGSDVCAQIEAAERKRSIAIRKVDAVAKREAEAELSELFDAQYVAKFGALIVLTDEQAELFDRIIRSEYEVSAAQDAIAFRPTGAYLYHMEQQSKALASAKSKLTEAFSELFAKDGQAKLFGQYRQQEINRSKI